MDYQNLHESIIQFTNFSYARSGGKGGQNVNKVNTKVHATLPIDCINGLNEIEKINLLQRLSGSINKDNCIFVDVQNERFQSINKKISLVRLENRILKAIRQDIERIPTCVSKSAKLKRLAEKNKISEKKESRRFDKKNYL